MPDELNLDFGEEPTSISKPNKNPSKNHVKTPIQDYSPSQNTVNKDNDSMAIIGALILILTIILFFVVLFYAILMLIS
jgi:beta-lactamase regulating signal transducer with metallopeptidase domain